MLDEDQIVVDHVSPDGRTVSFHASEAQLKEILPDEQVEMLFENIATEPDGHVDQFRIDDVLD